LSGLEVPYGEAFTVDLHITGLDDKEYSLVLNDAPAMVLKSNELNSIKVNIYPNEKVTVQQQVLNEH
jgi:hypothetical protein